MNSADNLSERASLSLIATDAEMFRDFALGPHSDPEFGIAALALMPFLAAFAYESARYVERRDPAAVHALEPQQKMLLTSRMRAKVTEDKYRSSAEVLDNVNELAKINSAWFMENHRGVLGSLKRALQPEVGVYFVGGEVICTTHVAFFNLGLSKEDLSDASLSLDNLGPHMRDRMVDVGRYLATLLDKLGLKTEVSGDASEGQLPRILDRDMKSARLYEPIIHRVAPGRNSVGILLTWLLSQVNTARALVPNIAGRNEAAAFKVRFISLYQASLSLHRLLEEEREHDFLCPHAIERITDIVNAAPVRSVLSYRELRNDLFHYGISRGMAPHLDPEFPLFGLVEARTNGKSFAAVADEVALGLDRVSGGLRDLLPRIPSPRGTTRGSE